MEDLIRRLMEAWILDEKVDASVDETDGIADEEKVKMKAAFRVAYIETCRRIIEDINASGTHRVCPLFASVSGDLQ